MYTHTLPISDDYHKLCEPSRNPQALFEQTRAQWRQRLQQDGQLWVFAYASLIWRPDFEPLAHRLAKVHGWHRDLAMWSRVNRGTPEQPGLVFAMLPGGSCNGVALGIRPEQSERIFEQLWNREMPTASYDPRWLPCQTSQGPIHALAFTLSRRSNSYAGRLSAEQYKHIFKHAKGRYGRTLDYAQETLHGLRANGINDHHLRHTLAYAQTDPVSATG